MKGVLTFHSETGTEGGYWAFQDEKYIKQNHHFGYCKKCGIYFGYMKSHPDNLSVKQSICEHEEYVGESWDYAGLHILRNGDNLKIFSKENPKEIIWEGEINLKEFDLFTEDALGFWIHADQVGEEREKWARWFLKNYPAELERKRS